MPPFLLPRKGRYGLRDYQKMFCPDLKDHQDIFDMRGIDRQKGCWLLCGQTSILPRFSHSMRMPN
jgi:phenol 2-monooxygenase